MTDNNDQAIGIEVQHTISGRWSAWQWLDRAAKIAVILIAIGVGVLVWQSEPDTVPASDLTPATPAPTTAPLVTEAPATPIIGEGGGCSEEQKRACKNMLCATDACAACCLEDEAAPQESCEALKIACDIGDVDACIEAKTRHCDLVDSASGYDGAQATPAAKIAEAQALIEEAHEGIGNVWHNDIHTGQPDCSSECMAAINDAASKTQEARGLLGADILGMHTWDKNQTIAHAFDAALYWINQVNIGETDSGDAAPHALYQLGILRDVLKP